MNELVLVDYGVGNLLSVRRALEACGARVDATDDPERIAAAPRLVLPGVGAFGDCMDELRRRDLVEPLRTYATGGRPFLGICVGMQMLFDVSEEFGEHKGLGVIPGRVVRIASTTSEGSTHKIPHIGWSSLQPATPWAGSVLADLHPGECCYFVHSFTAEPDDDGARLADVTYGGRRISAVVRAGNAYGCQFHPEKSGPTGLRMLRTFVSLPAR